MPLRYFFSLLLLIVAPLVVIGWLGTTALSQQRQQQQEILRNVFEDRLGDLDRDLQAVSRRYESVIGNELRVSDRKLDSLRKLRQTQPEVRSVMLVDRDGRLIYPAPPSGDDAGALAWHSSLATLARSRPLLLSEDSVVPRKPATRGKPSSSGSYLSKSIQSVAGKEQSSKQSRPTTESDLHWQTWYHEGGMQLVLWLPRSDRSATGVVLERGRWMADLIDALPESSNSLGQYKLADSGDVAVYSFGGESAGKPAAIGPPLASVRLSVPWNAWRLSYTEDQTALGQSIVLESLPLFALLSAIAIGVMGLGAYLITSLRRQMKLAQQRVSFASHVSHELRTPLTNIRLYAELARRDLQSADQDPASTSAVASSAATSSATGRIDVIEEETRRLSRIVTGVLDMVSGKGKLKSVSRVPDNLIEHVVNGFRPALEALPLSIELNLNAGEPIGIDEDVVELVLVNLLSNVEKYGGRDGKLRISSQQQSAVVTIDVQDEGPGVSKANAKQVFRPFVRLDDSLSAPAGTGLGLSIARNAARRHGGDLVLVPSPTGAHFRFTFGAAHASAKAKKKS